MVVNLIKGFELIQLYKCGFSVNFFYDCPTLYSASFFFRKYQTIEQTSNRLVETLAQIFNSALSFVYVDSD